MNFDPIIKLLDRFQQRHYLTALAAAVIKRYADDKAGYQAALLTYYGYLSLFPLLLIIATVAQMVASTRPALQERIISATASYFPVLGDQLAEHVHSLHKSGLALFIGLVFLLYGARGVAAAFRHAVNTIWGTPEHELDHFPASAMKNLTIIIVGALGFFAAAATAAAIAAAGHGWLFRLLSIVANVAILYYLFILLLRISLPKRQRAGDARLAAIGAAVGLAVLQLLGGYILVRVLKNLDALYSYFALSLGLLFWLYLQAQLVCYALELSVVQRRRLWPVSLSGQTTPSRRSAAKTPEAST